MKSIVVKARKLYSAVGYARYLQDKEEHPDICYVNSTCEKKLWHEYAKVSQEQFKATGQNNGKKKCVEAREFIFVFPKEFYKLKIETLIGFVDKLMDEFKNYFGTEVMIALHGNDKDSKNLHIHLMVMEREKIVTKEKIATRRLYFDDQGKQVKSRKYALDENGKLKPGYSFVKKGEKYGEASWSGKKKWIRSNETTENLKELWARRMNRVRIHDKHVEERTVYNRKTSPYFPLQNEYRPKRYADPIKQQESILKAQNLSEPIRKSNAIREKYNRCVDEALLMGVDEKELLEHRKHYSLEMQNAIKYKRPYRIDPILNKAVESLERHLDKIRAPQNDFKGDLSNTTQNIDDLINAAQRQKKALQKGINKQWSRRDER